MRGFGLVLALAGCDGVFHLTHVPDPVDGGGGPGSADAARPMGCPAEYIHSVGPSLSYYSVVKTKRTWPNAAADCADDAQGMTHLLVPSNQAELTAIIIDPDTYLTDDTWIGASAIVKGGNVFQWVSDEDTAGYIVPAEVGHYPWEGGEPNGVTGCAELRGKQDPAVGGLHDEECKTSNPTAFYICECDGRPDVPSHSQ